MLRFSRFFKIVLGFYISIALIKIPLAQADPPQDDPFVNSIDENGLVTQSDIVNPTIEDISTPSKLSRAEATSLATDCASHAAYVIPTYPRYSKVDFPSDMFDDDKVKIESSSTSFDRKQRIKVDTIVTLNALGERADKKENTSRDALILRCGFVDNTLLAFSYQGPKSAIAAKPIKKKAKKTTHKNKKANHRATQQKATNKNKASNKAKTAKNKPTKNKTANKLSTTHKTNKSKKQIAH